MNGESFASSVCVEENGWHVGRAKVVGICGCTNAGKTTVAKELVKLLSDGSNSATLISQDDFFLPKDCVRRVWKEGDPTVLFYDYDSPSSVDEKSFLNELKKATETHDFVVVEGNMLTELPKILKLIHRVLFITLDKDTCQRRRVKRTYDPPDVPGYFDQVVWPSYQVHLENALAMARDDGRLTFLDGREEATLEKIAENLRYCFSDLVRIQFDPINAQEATKFVGIPSCGAISVFIGTTRDTFNGKTVVRLEYEAYDQMAYQELRKLCMRVRNEYPSIERVAIIHRIGEVAVGEESVVIATSSPHRRDAIHATEMLIDELKRVVPIWKKEVYGDGSASWKENGEFKCNLPNAELSFASGDQSRVCGRESFWENIRERQDQTRSYNVDSHSGRKMPR
ncbi:Protein T27A3.6 [Aphelenchoides avenae]|nr:Protein T27A3.6 [Aphelenchus avenae]